MQALIADLDAEPRLSKFVIDALTGTAARSAVVLDGTEQARIGELHSLIAIQLLARQRDFAEIERVIDSAPAGVADFVSITLAFLSSKLMRSLDIIGPALATVDEISAIENNALNATAWIIGYQCKDRLNY